MSIDRKLTDISIYFGSPHLIIILILGIVSIYQLIASAIIGGFGFSKGFYEPNGLKNVKKGSAIFLVYYPYVFFKKYLQRSDSKIYYKRYFNISKYKNIDITLIKKNDAGHGEIKFLLHTKNNIEIKDIEKIFPMDIKYKLEILQVFHHTGMMKVELKALIEDDKVLAINYSSTKDAVDRITLKRNKYYLEKSIKHFNFEQIFTKISNNKNILIYDQIRISFLKNYEDVKNMLLGKDERKVWIFLPIIGFAGFVNKKFKIINALNNKTGYKFTHFLSIISFGVPLQVLLSILLFIPLSIFPFLLKYVYDLQIKSTKKRFINHLQNTYY